MNNSANAPIAPICTRFPRFSLIEIPSRNNPGRRVSKGAKGARHPVWGLGRCSLSMSEMITDWGFLLANKNVWGCSALTPDPRGPVGSPLGARGGKGVKSLQLSARRPRGNDVHTPSIFSKGGH